MTNRDSYIGMAMFAATCVLIAVFYIAMTTGFTSESRKQYQAENAQHEAEARAQEQEKEANALIERRDHAEDEARYACHDQIKSILKAPATARFPSVLEESVVNHGQGHYTVGTYVDAQNSFGALLRSNFTCEAVTKDGTSFSALAVER